MWTVNALSCCRHACLSVAVLQEFLMAGCWLLLKNPTNRQVLGNAFSTNPASTKLAQGMVEKLQATVDVADVNEAVSSSMGCDSCSTAAQYPHMGSLLGFT